MNTVTDGERTKLRKKKQRTNQEYQERFDRVKDEMLAEGETAVQMVNHNPMYFISDQGRVFSVSGKNVRELKQVVRAKTASGNCAQGSNIQKAVVCLRGTGGTQQVYYVHKLVAEYFPINRFCPDDSSDKTIIHHIEQYDMDTPTESNRADNLLETTQAIHSLIHAMPINPTEKERMEWNKRLDRCLGDYNSNNNLIFLYKRYDGKECGIVEVTWQEFINMIERSIAAKKQEEHSY